MMERWNNGNGAATPTLAKEELGNAFLSAVASLARRSFSEGEAIRRMADGVVVVFASPSFPTFQYSNPPVFQSLWDDSECVSFWQRVIKDLYAENLEFILSRIRNAAQC